MPTLPLTQQRAPPRSTATTLTDLPTAPWEKCYSSGVSKEQRRLYICPQCNGARVIPKWQQANLTDHPEVAEIQTTELCPTCDGSGQILGQPT